MDAEVTVELSGTEAEPELSTRCASRSRCRPLTRPDVTSVDRTCCRLIGGRDPKLTSTAVAPEALCMRSLARSNPRGHLLDLPA